MPKKQNLINQHFNFLTVIRDSGERNASGCVLWECKCDCGKLTLASGTDLKSGHKKSCGCY